MAGTMKCKSSVEHNGEIIPIDNQLLFQRLSIIAGRDHLELKSALNYELTTLPGSLFDRDGFMRDANKPALADVIWKVAENCNPILPNDKKFVLDGGSLLARHGKKVKPWQKFVNAMLMCLRIMVQTLKWCLMGTHRSQLPKILFIDGQRGKKLRW